MRLRTLESPRRGLASLEEVIAIGITLPVVALLMAAGIKISQGFFRTIYTLVLWPYM